MAGAGGLTISASRPPQTGQPEHLQRVTGDLDRIDRRLTVLTWMVGLSLAIALTTLARVW